MGFFLFFGRVRDIAQQIQFIMATLAEFKAALDKITAATDNIAADLKRLADKIEQGGISATDEAELLATLNAAATKLEEVAAINSEPTPEPTDPA